MLGTTESRIEQVFSQYSPVERVKKIRDYAFVHFLTRDGALKAMKMLNGIAAICALMIRFFNSCLTLLIFISLLQVPILMVPILRWHWLNLLTRTLIHEVLDTTNLCRLPPPYRLLDLYPLTMAPSCLPSILDTFLLHQSNFMISLFLPSPPPPLSLSFSLPSLSPPSLSLSSLSLPLSLILHVHVFLVLFIVHIVVYLLNCNCQVRTNNVCGVCLA